MKIINRKKVENELNVYSFSIFIKAFDLICVVVCSHYGF